MAFSSVNTDAIGFKFYVFTIFHWHQSLAISHYHLESSLNFYCYTLFVYIYRTFANKSGPTFFDTMESNKCMRSDLLCALMAEGLIAIGDYFV